MGPGWLPSPVLLLRRRKPVPCGADGAGETAGEGGKTSSAEQGEPRASCPAAPGRPLLHRACSSRSRSPPLPAARRVGGWVQHRDTHRSPAPIAHQVLAPRGGAGSGLAEHLPAGFTLAPQPPAPPPQGTREQPALLPRCSSVTAAGAGRAGSTRSINCANVMGGEKSQLRGAGRDVRELASAGLQPPLGVSPGALPGWIGPRGPPGRGSWGGAAAAPGFSSGEALEESRRETGLSRDGDAPSRMARGAPRTPPVMETPPRHHALWPRAASLIGTDAAASSLWGPAATQD